MKTILGLYTLMTSVPASVYDRALALVYEPVLSYMYNHEGQHLALYQSSSMMKHIQRERPEYKALIATLCQKKELEPISGSYSQAILSLLPPKDRVSQLERMTSFIRHEYGVLPTAAFFYGQIWHPYYISSLQNAGIDNVVISSYCAHADRNLASEPFAMNELGRKERIFPFEDEASLAVRNYSEGKLSFEELSVILLSPKKGEDCRTLFLNVDQLVMGALRENTGSVPGELVVALLKSNETVSPASVPVVTPGYLSNGWYGRDAVNNNLASFNEVFVRNEGFRYLYNRYISLAEGSQSRNNKLLKKDVTTALFNVATGPLFIQDSQATPMRYSSRRGFWSSILEAENRFLEYTESTAYREYDLEDIGRSDVFMSNGVYTAVISPKGAAIPEFDYMPKTLNLFDCRSKLQEGFFNDNLKKSFLDRLVVNGKEYSTENTFFSMENMDRKRSDLMLMSEEDGSPFSVVKRYKLRSSTFILDVTVSNRSEEKLSGTYSCEVNLNSSSFKLLGSDQRMAMVTNRFVKARTVKYGTREEEGLEILLSSTLPFTLTEEDLQQAVFTSNGSEMMDLGKKIVFSFPLEAEKGESVPYRLVLRINDTNKEKP